MFFSIWDLFREDGDVGISVFLAEPCAWVIDNLVFLSLLAHHAQSFYVVIRVVHNQGDVV